MPLPYLVRNLTSAQTSTNLQISVAIDPQELLLTNPNYKKIMAVLKGLSGYPVNVTIQIIKDEMELENYYFDFDKNRKPEILITIADAAHALKMENYKNMLLFLWNEFQMVGIDLLLCVHPEWHIIPGPDGSRSPFSVNHNQQKITHPILEVKFDADDLETVGIKFDYENYRDKFYSAVNKNLNEGVQQIQSEKIVYRTILHDDDFINKHFIEKIKVYQTILLDLRKKYGNDGEREEEYMKLVAGYQDLFDTGCAKDTAMQIFIHHYPRNENGTLDEYVAQLVNLKQLSQSDIFFIIKKMRESYNKKLPELKKEFYQFFNDLDLATEKTPSYSEFINICHYIKEEVAILIEKNPSKMQVILAQLKYAYQEHQISQFQSLVNDTKKQNSYFYAGTKCFGSFFWPVIKPAIPAPIKEWVLKP